MRGRGRGRREGGKRQGGRRQGGEGEGEREDDKREVGASDEKGYSGDVGASRGAYQYNKQQDTCGRESIKNTIHFFEIKSLNYFPVRFSRHFYM